MTKYLLEKNSKNNHMYNAMDNNDFFNNIYKSNVFKPFILYITN